MRCRLSTITLKAVAPAGSGAAGRARRLEPGSELVARLVSAPPNGGRGLISLAGMMLEAQLPAGLLPGQKLHLRVVEARPGQLRVRIVTQPPRPEEATESVTKLAGELAARGDGALLRAALHFADGSPLWLPGGVAAQIHVDPEARGGGRAEGPARGPAGEAGFILHSPELGAIEVRLRMAEGGVQRDGRDGAGRRRQARRRRPARPGRRARAGHGPPGRRDGRAARSRRRPPRRRREGAFDGYA